MRKARGSYLEDVGDARAGRADTDGGDDQNEIALGVVELPPFLYVAHGDIGIPQLWDRVTSATERYPEFDMFEGAQQELSEGSRSRAQQVYLFSVGWSVVVWSGLAVAMWQCGGGNAACALAPAAHRAT